MDDFAQSLPTLYLGNGDTVALCPNVRAYLLSTDNGRLLLGNAFALIRMGLLTSREVVTFVKEAHRMATNASMGRASIKGFETAMHRLRFQEASGAALGYPHENRPDVSAQSIYTVMPLRYLQQYVPKDAPLRTLVTLPHGEHPADEQGFLIAWAALSGSDRRFRLDSPLGRPLIWVTDQRTVERTRQIPRADEESEADAFIKMLGLGHYPVSRWAVILSIPGRAVQAAGHYRPTFADGIEHRFFMARSSLAGSATGQWGQTADLGSLAGPSYDGGSERVSRQLRPDHFESGETIEVELLDRVTRNPFYDDPPPVPPALARGVWSRRRW